MTQVKNMSQSAFGHKYIVVNDCTDLTDHNHGYWFYGAYDDVTRASEAAQYAHNGLILESNEVVAV